MKLIGSYTSPFVRKISVILLEKRIPMQAGMAGGSADGAAVLQALRSLYAPEMPRQELERIGLQVGSDVPFCVRGGTALAEGRGEVLTDLPPLPACAIVVCKPEFGLSTPALFGRVQVEKLSRRPDHDAMKRALTAGNLGAVAQQMGNVFEEVLTAEESREIAYLDDIKSLTMRSLRGGCFHLISVLYM